MRLIFLLLCVWVSTAMGAAESFTFQDSADEARFIAFTKNLRCLKCEHQSIAESDSDFSKDLKQWVYEMILTGKTDAEIKLMLQERFGDRIFMTPPWQTNTKLLWGLPLCFLGIAIWQFMRRVKR